MNTQKTRVDYDKENPPHPFAGLKKHSFSEEPSYKKTILGDPCHNMVLEDDHDEESLGDKLMQKKREFQRKRQNKEFSFRLFQC